MAHDHAYFRRREAEARAAASCREDCEDVEVAGQLALAYAALARRTRKPAEAKGTVDEDVRA